MIKLMKPFVIMLLFVGALKAQSFDVSDLKKENLSSNVYQTKQKEFDIFKNKVSKYCDYETVKTYNELGYVTHKIHTSPCDSIKEANKFFYVYKKGNLAKVFFHSPKQSAGTVPYMIFFYKDSMSIKTVILDFEIKEKTKKIITNVGTQIIEIATTNKKEELDSIVRIYENGTLKFLNSFVVKNDFVNQNYAVTYNLKTINTQFYNSKNKESFSKLDSINSKGDIYKTVTSASWGDSESTIEYKYDDHGNWIEKKDIKGQLGRFYTREITYFE